MVRRGENPGGEQVKDFIAGLSGAAVGVGIIRESAEYVSTNYDKIAGAVLAIVSTAFILWRWRQSYKERLCRRRACVFRSPEE